MSETNTHLSALRALLDVPPSAGGWEAICARFDTLPDASLPACLDYAEDHLASWPVTLRRPPDSWWERFIASERDPRMTLVRFLDCEGITAEELDALLASPHIASLVAMDFFDADVEPREVLRRLGEIGALDRLVYFGMTFCDLGDDGLMALIEASRWERLQELVIYHNALTDAGLDALARSGRFGALRSINLAGNPKITGKGQRLLRASPGLPALEVVEGVLDGLRASLAGAVPPAGDPAMSAATRLDIALVYLSTWVHGWTCAPDLTLPDHHHDANPKDEARLTWSSIERAKAFDALGALRRPFSLRFDVDDASGSPVGNWMAAQTAFAQASLACTVDKDARVVTLDPTTLNRQTDLVRLCRAFMRLRAKVYWAEPNCAMTQSMGWEDAWEACTRGVDGDERRVRAVFWTFQGHDGHFDAYGDLISPLALYWAGDDEEIRDTLRAEGLEVTMPSRDGEAFFVGPRRHEG